MKPIKLFTSLLMSMLMAAFIGTAVASQTNLDPLQVGLPVFLAIPTLKIVGHLTGMPTFNLSGYSLMGVQSEIWVDYIIESLFKENPFLDKCFNESDNVLAGAVVHIPQAGAASAVVKNRSTFPATAVRRTDTDITYPLDVYSSDPRHITDAESKEVSYDKMNSALGEDVNALSESFAEDLLYKWAPTVTGQILRTTGTADALALSPSATGTRNALVKEDLKRAQALMNKQNISKAERYALIPSDMYQQLTSDATLMARDGINGNELSLKDGVILRLYGFEIMERSDTTIYTNATPPVPKAPGATAAVSDNQAVICWQKNAVSKALGSTKFFENTSDALYYGDVFSMEVKMGGRKRRSDGKGVIAIVQAHGA